MYKNKNLLKQLTPLKHKKNNYHSQFNKEIHQFVLLNYYSLFKILLAA